MAWKRDQNEGDDDLGLTADGGPAIDDEAGPRAAGPDAADASGGELGEVERLREEVQSWKDKFLRAKAEQQNALRRAATERDEIVRYGNSGLLRGVIAVLDDLDRTIQAAEQNPSVESLLAGARLLRQNFDKLLAENRVEIIEAQGQPFDPQRHEALMRQPTADHAPGTVVQQVQRGYSFHDRVLRPAKVIVAGPPAGEDHE